MVWDNEWRYRIKNGIEWKSKEEFDCFFIQVNKAVRKSIGEWWNNEEGWYKVNSCKPKQMDDNKKEQSGGKRVDGVMELEFGNESARWEGNFILFLVEFGEGKREKKKNEEENNLGEANDSGTERRGRRSEKRRWSGKIRVFTSQWVNERRDENDSGESIKEEKNENKRKTIKRKRIALREKLWEWSRIEMTSLDEN